MRYSTSTPAHVVETIRPVIEDVTGKSRGGVLTVAGLGALWVASNAVEAMRVALDRAYDSEGASSFIRRRAVAIGFVILAMITFAMLGALIILAPLALKLAQDLIATVTPFDAGFVLGVGVVRYVSGPAGLCRIPAGGEPVAAQPQDQNQADFPRNLRCDGAVVPGGDGFLDLFELCAILHCDLWRIRWGNHYPALLLSDGRRHYLWRRGECRRW